jgi:WD40 repeat protein
MVVAECLEQICLCESNKPCLTNHVEAKVGVRHLSFFRKTNAAHQTNSATVPQHQSDEKLRGHRGFVACLDFSPDVSNLLASGDSAHVKLWNVEQAACMFSFKSDSPDRPHFRCSLLNLSFSKDGKHVASAGYDKSIRMWPTKPILRECRNISLIKSSFSIMNKHVRAPVMTSVWM